MRDNGQSAGNFLSNSMEQFLSEAEEIRNRIRDLPFVVGETPEARRNLFGLLNHQVDKRNKGFSLEHGTLSGELNQIIRETEDRLRSMKGSSETTRGARD